MIQLASKILCKNKYNKKFLLQILASNLVTNKTKF